MPRSKLNRLGATLIELMIVIAIMAILSMTFYINTRPNMRKQVEQSTEELLANLRQARNMAISKTTHQFAGESQARYPTGGYGLVFDGTAAPARYFIYADKSGNNDGYQAFGGDEIIGAVINLPTPTPYPFELVNDSDNDPSFYFAILSEKQVVTDMTADVNNRFIVRLRWPGPGSYQNGYEGVIRLGEQAGAGSILTNFGAVYSDYVPPPPPPLPPPQPCGKACDL